jgi:hypothetical protein
LFAISLLLVPAVAAPGTTPGAWLGDLSWPQAQRRLEEAPVVVLPFGPGAKIHYVQEVARSLVRGGAKRLAILNTSIAKAAGLPLAIVARDLREQTGTPTLLVSWDDLENDECRALETQRQGGHADGLAREPLREEPKAGPPAR